MIKKADGSKFGKSEAGNVWLDPKRTTPYQFYQFWLNASDEDAKNFIRIFTFLDKATIEALEAEHAKAPHQRLLQKELAKDITIRVHSAEDYSSAVDASDILFGKGTAEALLKLSEQDLLTVFQGVPQVNIAKADMQNGINVVDFLCEKTNIFPSRSEARKMIEGGGVSINKSKVEDVNQNVSLDDMLKDKYILAQKGKKNYYLISIA